MPEDPNIENNEPDSGALPDADDPQPQGDLPAPEPGDDEGPQPDEPDEVSLLRAEIERMRARDEERERRLMDLLERQNQKPEPQGEPDIDPRQIITDSFQGQSAEALLKVVDALESRYSKQFARRQDIDPLQRQTAQMARSHEEQQAMQSLRSRGVPEADVKEIQNRITEWAKAHPGQVNPNWPSAEAAYAQVFGEIAQERLYGQADAARKRKEAVVARAAKNKTPVNEPPAGSGKIELDLRKQAKKSRKELGRARTTEEILEDLEKASA